MATKKRVPKSRPNLFDRYQVTKSYYSLKNGRWVRTDQRTTMESSRHVQTILSDTPQPYEKSHRLYKQSRGAHRYDTYETVSPDGKRKFVAYVNFGKGKK